MPVPVDAWPDDPHAACMEPAARGRGLQTARVNVVTSPGAAPVEWLGLSINGRRHLYRRGQLLLDRGGWYGRVNDDVWTVDKQATKRRIAALGAPVAEGRLFQADEEPAALRYFLERGCAACVKPNTGTGGRGVFPLITDPRTFAGAFRAVASHCPQVLVEEYLVGAPVRLLYAAPAVIGSRVGRPASVVGNGADSIAALVAAKNEERRRRALPEYAPIVLEAEALRFLAGQGIGPEHVPPAGRRVYLRGVSNLSAGSDCVSCAGRLHPSYAALVEGMCRSLPGLRLAAVDMIIRDLEAPAAPGNHWVLEMNSAPGVVTFHHPWEGEPQDVCGAVLDRLLSGAWDDLPDGRATAMFRADDGDA